MTRGFFSVLVCLGLGFSSVPAHAAAESRSVSELRPERSFTIGLESGYRDFTHNRGKLWQTNMLSVGATASYWVDSQIALRAGVHQSKHYYETEYMDRINVTLNEYTLGLGVTFTRPSRMSMSLVPFVFVDASYFAKGEHSEADDVTSRDSVLGLTGGAGVEWHILPSRAALQIQGKMGFAAFEDQLSNQFASQGIPDLNGLFYSASASLAISW